MSRVDAYLDAMIDALRGVGDFQPRPFHIVEVTPYFLDLEALDLTARLRRLEAEGAAAADIGQLFPGANSIKTLLMDIVCGMKMAEVDAADRVWFVERMFDAMASLESGDIFCRDGSHRLMTRGQAQKFADNCSWKPVDGPSGRADAKAAYRVSACGQAMVWGLYFYAWTDMGWEVHGPYEVDSPDGRSQLMLVRDYFDLAPTLLWPEISGWPVRTMRLASLHEPSEDIRLDVLNHVWHDRSWIDSSLAVDLRVDDAPIGDPAAALAVSRDLADMARDLQTRIDGMNRIALLKRFAESRYYALRHWRTRFGDDWRPPREVERRIEADPHGQVRADTSDLAGLRLAFDPRSEVLN
ncbi:MAG: hypothetical protein ACRDNF_07585 [Streptosporangiaceae bacterium]